MKLFRILVGAALACAGVVLLADTLVFDTYPADPATGREKGCYTTLERWAGVKAPSAIADVERACGVVLLVAGGVVSWPRRRSRLRSAAPTTGG